MHVKGPVSPRRSSVNCGNNKYPSMYKGCQSIHNVEVGHYKKEEHYEKLIFFSKTWMKLHMNLIRAPISLSWGSVGLPSTTFRGRDPEQY